MQDSEKNETLVLVWRQGAWRRIRSRDLLVGDIITVVEDKRVPADILLIGTENGTHAFVDTKDLDGWAAFAALAAASGVGAARLR